MHRLREQAADALVLDPDLPWGGGEGVLAVMSGTPQWADIPVIVLTAARDARVLDGLAHFAIHDFQLKPCPPSALVARIRRLFDPALRRETATTRGARLERVIARRTGNAIRHLRVEATAEQIVIYGAACSRDVGQAAIAAVNDSLRRTEAAPTRVELNLEVAADLHNLKDELTLE
jgi:DNA-binding response OmpR family regulator